MDWVYPLTHKLQYLYRRDVPPSDSHGMIHLSPKFHGWDMLKRIRYPTKKNTRIGWSIVNHTSNENWMGFLNTKFISHHQDLLYMGVWKCCIPSKWSFHWDIHQKKKQMVGCSPQFSDKSHGYESKWGASIKKLEKKVPQSTPIMAPIIHWLVVSTPLKNISQLGWLFPIYRKIKNVPNHQPVE